MLDPWPLQPFEPVAYFDFGWSVELTGSISWRKPWKYVKLVPTGFKTTPKNSLLQERFDSYPIEFQFFGVCGDEVETTVDFTEYSNGVTLPHNIQNVCKTGYSFNLEMHVWTQQQTLENDETDPSRDDKDHWYWETILVDQPGIWIDEIQNFESNRKLYVFFLPTIWKLARIKNITGISKVKLTTTDFT